MKITYFGLPTFAGIALADILANSAAILILLIVIALSIIHEKENKRLENINDVTVLLSRDLSTSVVMNGLPSSAPAWLHDYRDLGYRKEFSHMPILELYAGYVRNYYNGHIFPFSSLLQPKETNPLEAFLISMSQYQLANIRVDVYDIQTFYVSMSIIQKYLGRLPRHWHFMGEAAVRTGQDIVYRESPSPGTPSDAGMSIADEENSMSSSDFPIDIKDLEGEFEGLGNVSLTADFEYLQLWGNIPFGSQFGDRRDGELGEHYPFDDLAYDHSSYGGDKETPIAERKEDSSGDMERDFLDAMSVAMRENLGGTPASGYGLGTTTMRFRTANPRGQESSTFREKQVRMEHLPLLPHQLLTALLQFMKVLEQRANEGEFDVLAKIHWDQDFLEQIEHLEAMADPKIISLADSLLDVFSQGETSSSTLRLEQQSDERIRFNRFAVQFNRSITQGVLQIPKNHEHFHFLPSAVRVTVQTGLYPTIFEGVRVEISEGNLIIVLPRNVYEEGAEEFGWKLVALVSQERDDYLLGFVDATFDDSYQFLLLDADTNDLLLDSSSAMTSYPVDAERKTNEATVALAILGIMLLLLCWLLARYRRGIFPA